MLLYLVTNAYEKDPEPVHVFQELQFGVPFPEPLHLYDPQAVQTEAVNGTQAFETIPLAFPYL